MIVGRSFTNPRQRLRALAAVTLFGGLASTVFLPATAVLVSSWGWRRAVLVLAVALAISTAVTRTLVFSASGPSERHDPHPTGAIPAHMRPTVPPGSAS